LSQLISVCTKGAARGLGGVFMTLGCCGGEGETNRSICDSGRHLLHPEDGEMRFLICRFSLIGGKFNKVQTLGFVRREVIKLSSHRGEFFKNADALLTQLQRLVSSKLFTPIQIPIKYPLQIYKLCHMFYSFTFDVSQNFFT